MRAPRHPALVVFGLTNLVACGLIVAGVALLFGTGPALIAAGLLAIALNFLELVLGARRR